jgi:circadian clock protein KaiC
MLEGNGYYKGASILVSGMPGSGKSTAAAHFANSICASGNRCIYFAMEESPQQIIRNMRSVGLNLDKWVDNKLLKFSARRPNLYGLETHLAAMHREVSDFAPAGVVVDPLSALMNVGLAGDVHSMLLRLLDFLKTRGITALFTNLGLGSAEETTTQMQISSLIDTWLLLYNRESNGEHNRQLYVLKSRGMAHSNQIREFMLSSDGIKLREAYIGPAGVLTGSARLQQEAKDRAAQLERQQEIERRSREVERKRREITEQIADLQAQLANEELLSQQAVMRDDQFAADRVAIATNRQAHPSGSAAKSSGKARVRSEKS